jgi:hypothetical protein
MISQRSSRNYSFDAELSGELGVVERAARKPSPRA